MNSFKLHKKPLPDAIGLAVNNNKRFNIIHIIDSFCQNSIAVLATWIIHQIFWSFGSGFSRLSALFIHKDVPV
jgi:hypothetical protein